MENDKLLDDDFIGEFEATKIDLLKTEKFTLLYFLSWGMYGIWWMYKTWKFFKEKDNLDIMPAVRALFGVLFMHSLYERILGYAKFHGYNKTFSSAGLLVLFIIFNVLSKLPDPFWLISFASIVCFIQPNRAFNYSIENAENYSGEYRSGFNPKQWFIILAGGLFWVLIIISLIQITNSSNLGSTNPFQ